MPKKVTKVCSNVSSCAGIDKCSWIRKDAIDLFRSKKFLSAKEVDKLLNDANIGVSARRKSLDFLSTDNACAWVEAINCRSENKPLRPKLPGRMFTRKPASDSEICQLMKSHLTVSQKHLLQTFEYYKSIHYLSTYDIRRLLPYTGHNLEFALTRLYDYRQVELMKKTITSYYCLPSSYGWLSSNIDQAELEDKIEIQAIFAFQKMVINLFPRPLLSRIKGIVRPSSRDPEMLRITRGMSFDIVYEFTTPVQGYRFFAVDIHTRIKVTKRVIRSFMKKIQSNPDSRIPQGTTSLLSDRATMYCNNTLGTIVYKEGNATPEALKFINSSEAANVQLVKLGDVGIDYLRLKESCQQANQGT